MSRQLIAGAAAVLALAVPATAAYASGWITVGPAKAVRGAYSITAMSRTANSAHYLRLATFASKRGATVDWSAACMRGYTIHSYGGSYTPPVGSSTHLLLDRVRRPRRQLRPRRLVRSRRERRIRKSRRPETLTKARTAITWEYKVVRLDMAVVKGGLRSLGKGDLMRSDSTKYEFQLNALGSEGWELVAAADNRLVSKRLANAA